MIKSICFYAMSINPWNLGNSISAILQLHIISDCKCQIGITRLASVQFDVIQMVEIIRNLESLSR